MENDVHCEAFRLQVEHVVLSECNIHPAAVQYCTVATSNRAEFGGPRSTVYRFTVDRNPTNATHDNTFSFLSYLIHDVIVEN